MLPLWIYEQLPLLYLLLSAVLWFFAHSPLLWLAAILLFVVGALLWMMRSNYRRTDLVIYPAKRWLQPEWYYEALPFLWLALGLAGGFVLVAWHDLRRLGAQGFEQGD